MTFFTQEAPSSYQIDLRDRHTEQIKLITGVSHHKAQQLSACLQLRDITEIPEAEILRIGFKQTQIKRLNAAYDFGKTQFLGVQKIDLGNVIDQPNLAAKHVQDLIGNSRIEKGCLLVLDVKHQLIHRQVFSIGSETECLVNPRILFEIGLRHGGTRFIFSHNHPSRSLEVSPEDISLTQQLLEGAKFMEIPMLDHLIVSRDRFTSLRQTTSLWD